MPSIISVDTETHLIADRRQYQSKGWSTAESLLAAGASSSARGRGVNLSPFVVPRVVCASLAAEYTEGTKNWIVRPDEMLQILTQAWEHKIPVVMHNAAFDVAVLGQVGCLGILHSLAHFNLLFDTMYYDMLLRLKQGRYDIARYPSFELEQLVPRGLGTLALDYLGLELDKDPAIRLNYGQYQDVPHERWPQAFQDYAKADALATLRVFQEIQRQAEGSLLSMPTQVRASLVVGRMDQLGVHIDKAEALRLKALFEKDMPELEEALVVAGLGQWKPEPTTVKEGEWEGEQELVASLPRSWARWDNTLIKFRVFKKKVAKYTTEHFAFHTLTKAVRDRLAAEIVPELTEAPKLTPGGGLSLDADFWAEHLPMDPTHPLRVWQKRQKLEKILSTYLNLYSAVDHIYAKWNVLGARSGRMSCARPNIQNIPKRKHGIRSVFVPEPDFFFAKGDYSTQELLTLAEAMFQQGIVGPLFDAISQGQDIHKATAAMIVGKPYTTEIETWVNSTIVPLLECFGGAALQMPDVGNGPGASVGDTERCWLGASGSEFIGLLSDCGLGRFRTAFSSVMPVTIPAALTQSTYLQGRLPRTAKTWFAKDGAEGSPHTLADLAVHIGREEFHSTLKSISESGVSPNERQAAKALDFGLPGGLGAKKLAEYAKYEYGVHWDLEEARAMRRKFLRVYPDIDEFLKRHSVDFNSSLMRRTGRGADYWRAEVGAESWISSWELRRLMHKHPVPAIRRVVNEAEHSLTVVLPSGRIRKGCTFTEGCNTFFQGLASDVTKEGAWLAMHRGLWVRLIVHDEIVIEAPERSIDCHAKALEQAMLDAFVLVCPTVGKYAKVEVTSRLTRWGKATDKDGRVV